MSSNYPLRSLAALALAFCAHAQSPCPAEDLSDHPGAWRPRSSYLGRSHRSAPPASYNRAAAEATLGKLLTLLQNAYPEPKGGIAYFSKHLLFSTPDPEWPFGYSLYVGHTGFYCTASGKLVESTESGVFLNLDVNSFDTASLIAPVDAPQFNTPNGSAKLNSGPEGGYLIGGRVVYRIPSLAESFRGVDRYSKTPMQGRGAQPAHQWFVVRNGDTPLFTPITRAQYLAQFRRELETYKARQIEMDLDWARQSGTNNAEWITKFSSAMDAYMLAVDSYLNNSPSPELARPMSGKLPLLPIDMDNPRLTFSEEDSFLVHLNQGYLDKARPLHVPQFFVIRLSIRDMRGPQPPWERRFRDQIQAGLDFNALKALLGR